MNHSYANCDKEDQSAQLHRLTVTVTVATLFAIQLYYNLTDCRLLMKIKTLIIYALCFLKTEHNV